MDLSAQSGREAKSRRQVLRWIAFSAMGAGIVLATGRLANATPPTRSEGSSLPVSATSPTNDAGNQSPATLRVKVMYFQMPITVDTKQEYFILQGPAHFQGLLDGILEKHPSLSPMMPGMMVLIDGARALPDTTLRNGDEVDFIPAIAGG